MKKVENLFHLENGNATYSIWKMEMQPIPFGKWKC